jgi:hypothetical protein
MFNIYESDAPQLPLPFVTLLMTTVAFTRAALGLNPKPLHHKPLLRACSLAPQFLCGFLPPSTRSVQMTLANTVNLALTPAQASAPPTRALPSYV